MASIFSKIIQREIPAFIVAEDDNYIAFLDAFPLVEGHTLVVPKKEVDKLWDLDKDTYLGLMEFAYKVSPAIAQAIPCLRVGMAVIGLEVPHVHIHLIPMNGMNDINFAMPKKSLSAAKMQEIADQIKAKIS